MQSILLKSKVKAKAKKVLDEGAGRSLYAQMLNVIYILTELSLSTRQLSNPQERDADLCPVHRGLSCRDLSSRVRS